jgi:hypothetical protein
MAKCDVCGKPAGWLLDRCDACEDERQRKLQAKRGTNSTSLQLQSGLILVTLFRVIAIAQVLGGVILCAQLWPSEADLRIFGGRTIAYMPALTWSIAGFVSSLLFWAVGDGLLYLSEINRSLQRLTNSQVASTPPSDPPF